MTKNRTEVADIDRSLYDFTYGEEGFERLDAGITPDIVLDQSDYYKLRPYLLNEENDIQIQAAKKELLKIIEGVN